MFLKRTLVAGLVVAATTVAANAADLTPLAPAPMAPQPMMSPTFSWGGPYVGAYGGYLFVGPGYGQAGAQAGYNFVSGGFLAGLEVQAGALIQSGIAFEGNLNARAGVILGSKLLLYGEGGLGWIPASSNFTYTFGGGAELAVGTALSVFAEGKAFGVLGGTCCGVVVQAGINWHPAY